MAHPGGTRASAFRLVYRLVTLVSVLAVATLPLGHDDLACHLTSTVHCATCGVGLDDDGASGGVPPAVTLQLAGDAAPGSEICVREGLPETIADRSPPRV